MRKSVSIVEARRDLGRLAEEVRRTGRPVVLTRRGRAVARIAPEPVLPIRRRDALGVLRGTLTINCSFRTLQHAIRELRGEFAQNLARRALTPSGRGATKRA